MKKQPFIQEDWCLNENEVKCPVCDKIYRKKGFPSHFYRKHSEREYNYNVFAWNKGLTKETNESVRKSSLKVKEGYEEGRIIPYWKGKHHTEETKEKLSEIRKLYLTNNRNKHNWSLYKNEETTPEKIFRECLESLNIQFTPYYIPPENDRHYELDFAIIDKKMSFEINGNQHYNKDGTLKLYYKERHDYFIDKGWNIIELPYMICFNTNLKEIISALVA